VRLFVFLSIVTFFIARLTISVHSSPINFNDDDHAIASAMTVAEVETLRDAGIAQLEKTRARPDRKAGADARLERDESALRRQAQARIDVLQAAAARNEPPPVSRPSITLSGDKPWDPKTNPLEFDVLPAFANAWINLQIGRAEGNVMRMQQDPSLFKDAILGAIPSTLFVLLPVFALMLEILYVFKRRLYMEHLIVALHSHAFLCLALLLVFLTMALRDAVAPATGFLHGLLGWAEGLLFAWMPIYLLRMQKRVYGQGWTMTAIKYCVLGFSYIVLLSFGAVFTVLASLVWA
jgi:hypothetical protein